MRVKGIRRSRRDELYRDMRRAADAEACGGQEGEPILEAPRFEVDGDGYARIRARPHLKSKPELSVYHSNSRRHAASRGACLRYVTAAGEVGGGGGRAQVVRRRREI